MTSTSSGTLAISALPTLDLDADRFNDHRKHIKDSDIASNLEKLYQLIHRLTAYNTDWEPTIHLIDNQDFFYVRLHNIRHNPSLFEVAKDIGYETHAFAVTISPDTNLWCFYYKSNTYTIPFVSNSVLDAQTKRKYRDVALGKMIIPSQRQFDILDKFQESVARQLLFEIIIMLDIPMDKITVLSKHVTHGKTMKRKSNDSESTTDNEFVESKFVLEIQSCVDTVSVYDVYSHFKSFSCKGFIIDNIRYEDKPKSITFSMHGEVKKRNLPKRQEDIIGIEDISDDDGRHTEEEEEPNDRQKKKKKNE